MMRDADKYQSQNYAPFYDVWNGAMNLEGTEKHELEMLERSESHNIVRIGVLGLIENHHKRDWNSVDSILEFC